MSRRPGNPPPAAAPPVFPAGWAAALILLATVVAYLPAIQGGFIWDDSGHVTRADLRSLAGLYRIWFEIGATQQYYPVLHSAFWLEHGLWGDSPLGYHLLNVLLHATAACLFGTLLRRLAVPGAWLAALLFALHPVCVESVAWISEQKNTLSMVFYLAAALAYLRFDEQRRGRAKAVATAWFVLALLTKTVTASLPAALLVIFWWRRGRLAWRGDVKPLLPWFTLSLASGFVTARFERELIGAQGADFALGALDRCLLAGRVFWFYLGKLAWPADLIFIYPRWMVDATQVWQWVFLIGAIGLVAVLFWWRTRSRAPLAAVLLFGGTLFPVLGFVNVFPFLFSFVADHFQYLASLAIFALTGTSLTLAVARLPRSGRLAAAGALLALLGSLTWMQAGMYRDVLTLYQTTLAQNPACWMAHNNLAIALAQAGRVEEAVPHLEQALKLRPAFAEAENNLGDDLTRLGRAGEAVPHLERALQLQPRYADARNNLGSAFMALGRPPEGLAQFEQAVQLNPSYAVAQRNLGLALATAGRTAEAIPHFERAVQLNPADADAEASWAVALMLTGRFPDAVPHFEKAIALDPDSADRHNVFGRALAGAARLDEAVGQFDEALRLIPDHAEAHMNLAQALRRLGRMPEATQHYQEALRLNPRLAPSR